LKLFFKVREALKVLFKFGKLKLRMAEFSVTDRSYGRKAIRKSENLIALLINLIKVKANI
jgi:hypothetical protein